MAETTIQAKAPEGLALYLELFDVFGNTLLNNSPTGDAMTEKTNNVGTYTATVTEALTGVKEANIVDGDGNLIREYVTEELSDDTGTYRCIDLSASTGDVGEVTLSQDDIDDIVSGVVGAASALAVKTADSLGTDELQMITADTWVQGFTGLGDISTVDEILFAMKEDDEDVDADSLLFIRQSTGLEVFNKAVHATPGNATIVIDDAAAGDLTITVDSGFTGFAFGTNKGTLKLLDTSLDRTIVNRVIVNTVEGGVDEVT